MTDTLTAATEIVADSFGYGRVKTIIRTKLTKGSSAPSMAASKVGSWNQEEVMVSLVVLGPARY